MRRKWFQNNLKTAENSYLTAKAQLSQARGPGDKRTQQPLLYGSEESQRRGGGGIALPCRGIGQPQLAAAADNGQ